MTFDVLISRRAERQMRRLSDDLLRRVASAIADLADEPRPPGCRRLSSADAWRLRVGNLRIIYTIDPASARVTIEAVTRRDIAYRRL